MFKLRSLFWKIFFAFWLANLIVLVATTFTALHMSESQHVLERHKDAVLRSAAFITYRYEHGQQLDLRDEFNHFIQHSRHRRGPKVGRGANILIYGPKGELIFGKPKQHTGHRAHVEFEFTSGASNVYKIVSDRPKPPRFVTGWLARMHSVGLVFILLASALVSLLLTWLITRPLKHLGAHARHLAGGDFDTPMERKLLTRGDEIGDLAQEFDRMANQLGEMIASRQQLLHDVSHELRAPLARLQAAAALSQQRGASLDVATLQRVERECERMDKLLQQMLDYARTDQEQVSDETVELGAMLAERIEDVRLEYNNHPMRLQLPEQAISVQGNGELLRRAFENVLRNACKHTPEGTAVDVNLSRAIDTVVISVRDHGPGIEQHDLAQLLKPFYRAGNSLHADGFGLGLSIAARAVEKHGGRIDTSNHPQGGLQVSISLKAG